MTTERIRWDAGQFGNLVGYAGTVESWVFQVWHINDDEDSHWSLISSLPDAQNRNAADPDDPEKLKAEAERWLTEFACSLGASFPPGPVVSRCECGGLASHVHGCRWRQGYGSLIESVTDEAASTAAPTRGD